MKSHEILLVLICIDSNPGLYYLWSPYSAGRAGNTGINLICKTDLKSP